MAKIRYWQPRRLSGDVRLFPSDMQAAGRDAFYDALAAIAPHVLTDLESSCLPVLRQTDTARLAFAPPGAMQNVAPLGPRVATWVVRHRLAVPWLVGDAIMGLAELNTYPVGHAPELRLHAESLPSAAGRAPVAMGSVTLAFAWAFSSQPRAMFRGAMLESLAEKLDAELDRIEAEARATGAERTAKRALDRHMRWVVQRVVLGRTEACIASAESDGTAIDPPSRRAVELAIRDAARMIDLPVPPRKTGRPRKRPPARIVKNPRR